MNYMVPKLIWCNNNYNMIGTTLMNDTAGEKVYQCEGLAYIEINPMRVICANCGYQIHKAVIRGHTYFHLKQMKNNEISNEEYMSLAENDTENIELEQGYKDTTIKQDLKQARIIGNSLGKLNYIAERSKYIRKLKAYRMLGKGIF